MRLPIFTVVVISLLSCTEDTLKAQSSLTGKWVDVNTTTDTLNFLLVGDHEYVELSRGKELRNGVLRPKVGAGPYQYKLLSDKISLYWSLSSEYKYNDYFFSRSGDTLVVDNFYDPVLKGMRQTFKKLK